ncbi:DUF1272 domain-containing protein [Undibacterium sp. Di27W]|uniref:DUF1272 domain-containing protein n=1 Tax=Undibacterium sp. Di27W TaxID=3413036 RepID=UPI003BF1F34E
MLELRPNCEHCQTALPPSSADARICTFECTFCVHCVDNILFNVCPNCGGGFEKRPIRPSKNWKNENYLGRYPAKDEAKYKPIDQAEHFLFAGAIRDIKPEAR